MSGQNIASIDIGTHTARLLIAGRLESPRLFKQIARKRTYIYLSEGFDRRETASISSNAIERTIIALEDFRVTAQKFDAGKVLAVSTGIVRKSSNAAHFIRLIHDRTGIDVRIISGKEEAYLTGKGVLHFLPIHGPFVIFDLGGGTTEFVSGQENAREYRSIPLGAVELTQKYFDSDPPGEDKIKAISEYADILLAAALPGEKYSTGPVKLIGSGGTVTTLAAMLHGMDVRDISHERLNGMILHRDRIRNIFEKMRSLSLSERLKLPGLDRDRAFVILAGTVVVMRILHFFHSSEMTVSHSDILEGIVISYLKGEKNE